MCGQKVNPSPFPQTLLTVSGIIFIIFVASVDDPLSAYEVTGENSAGLNDEEEQLHPPNSANMPMPAMDKFPPLFFLTTTW